MPSEKGKNEKIFILIFQLLPIIVHKKQFNQQREFFGINCLQIMQIATYDDFVCCWHGLNEKNLNNIKKYFISCVKKSSGLDVFIGLFYGRQGCKSVVCIFNLDGMFPNLVKTLIRGRLLGIP